ncbi:MAG: Dolichol phosphate mannosyltransferase or dolichol phosphate beta glucosyltrandferase [Chloroflexi bacterium]|nr:Dolichol phosphate mannosyltransferase or dolichol phosphate beta glucosyltrandferase [Chloroflexota bacterium]
MRSVPGTDALHRCTVIIPALDEAGAIAGVVRGVPAGLHADVLVVDNGSRDGTADAAAAAGARVVREPRRGYGRACHTGVDASPDATVVVFIDGDGSMPPEEIGALVAPIVEGRADLVCGSRTARREAGSMPAHQALGNRLALLLLRRLYGVRLTDLGPYRAVRGELLRELGMRPSRFAWPAEMLARAARRRARIVEVEVGYRRRRAGASKVGGSLRGSLGAGLGIVGALLWRRVAPR